MTTPAQTLQQHAAAAQQAIKAQRESAAQIAAEAAANRAASQQPAGDGNAG
jgi:hypothetical protein